MPASLLARATWGTEFGLRLAHISTQAASRASLQIEVIPAKSKNPSVNPSVYLQVSLFPGLFLSRQAPGPELPKPTSENRPQKPGAHLRKSAIITKRNRKASGMYRLITFINMDPEGTSRTETYDVGVAQGGSAPSGTRSPRLLPLSTLLWEIQKGASS
jgi:hypothetical protein